MRLGVGSRISHRIFTEVMKPRDMSELEQALGYQFSRPKLLGAGSDSQLTGART